MYAEFYNLSKMPFDMTPDPDFHFSSDLHREALAAVTYGLLNNKGIISLIGEVGTGKTITLRTLLENPILSRFKIIYLFNPRQQPKDLVRNLLAELDMDAKETQSVNELFDILVNKIVEICRHDKELLIIFDEAQHVPDETLEFVRLLSNVDTSDRKLVQILLSGQPELRVKLQQPHLRQLRQRIAVSAHLEPMSYQETERYIAHRMLQAGAEYLPFYSDAFRQIIQITQGNPRLVNIVCDLCLANGMGHKKQYVDLAIVNEVIDDLQDTALAGIDRGQSLLDRRQSLEETQPSSLSGTVDL